MPDRGASPVVGKILELGIVVLYVTLLTTALYGTVLPDYRATAGGAVAERTVSLAAERVQQAVPPPVLDGRATVAVDLPGTIAGSAYRLRVEDRHLVLDHPDGIGARTRLALPERVVAVQGHWTSGGDPVVRVRSVEDGVAIALES